MKRLVLIIFLSSVALYSHSQTQTSFEVASKENFSVESETKTVKYLHFTITFEPIYRSGLLTDVYYRIDYHDIHSDFSRMWVELYDGHLINLRKLDCNKQWKGPFLGLNGVRYRFYLELVNDQVRVMIYSTDPDQDAKYYNSFFTEPFSVTAYCKNFTVGKKVIKILSWLSTIHSGFRVVTTVVKGANPTVLLVSSLAQEIGGQAVRYLIESHVSNLPIRVRITCNSCRFESDTVVDSLVEFQYSCPGCGQSAIIGFSG
jgi:hypothetical protein